ncbi:unnamed protein product [Prorocentrum cordatum]|uniref:Protein xylosyltransferase n=1 Tax=Prorocentrum cordatum TaxID=2364126 RepID=A0ABN9P683_9DINO|nr:unnamed protein product [Polarella glacialis]
MGRLASAPRPRPPPSAVLPPRAGRRPPAPPRRSSWAGCAMDGLAPARALVCLGGRVADLRGTAAGIAANLVLPLDADVFVYAPRRARRDADSLAALEELRARAPGRVAKVEFFDEDGAARAAFGRLPRPALEGLLAVGGNWLGGLPANLSGGAERWKFAAKGELFTYRLELTYLQHERCLRYYLGARRGQGRLVYTRTDFAWLCPHAPLELLDTGPSGSVWVPDSGWDDYGGVYDNHAVLEGGGAEAFLGSWRRLLDGAAAAALPAGHGSWVNPETYLAARLASAQHKGLAFRRYAQCAYRTCRKDERGRFLGGSRAGGEVSDGSGAWAQFPCDPATGARRSYPWEWAAATAVAACFRARGAPGRADGGWTPELLHSCYSAPVPFPQDAGFAYARGRPAAASEGPAAFAARCLAEHAGRPEHFGGLSGAPLADLESSLLQWSLLQEQRHECLDAQHKYLYVRPVPRGGGGGRGAVAPPDSALAFGLCVPAACSVEAGRALAARFASAAGLPGAAAAAREAAPPQSFAAEDPSTGEEAGPEGHEPLWSVPVSAVEGIDFVVAGPLAAGSAALFAALAAHPQVLTLGAQPQLLLQLGHEPWASARDRRLLLGRRGSSGPSGDALGLFDPRVLAGEAPAGRLRSLRRRRRVQLVVAVRSPTQVLEAALCDGRGSELPQAELLQAEALTTRVLLDWPEEDVLLVPHEAMAADRNRTLERVFRFLGLAPATPCDGRPTAPRRPRRARAPPCAGGPILEGLRAAAERYLAEEAVALRELAARLGGLAWPPTAAAAEPAATARCFGDGTGAMRSWCCPREAEAAGLPGAHGLRPGARRAAACAIAEAAGCCARFEDAHRALAAALRRRLDAAK